MNMSKPTSNTSRKGIYFLVNKKRGEDVCLVGLGFPRLDDPKDVIMWIPGSLWMGASASTSFKFDEIGFILWMDFVEDFNCNGWELIRG